jgi:AraC-like DNA-binding protein
MRYEACLMTGVANDIELLLRGGGVGGAVLLIAILLVRHRGAPAGRWGVVFAVSVASYLLCPVVAMRWQAGWWALPLVFFCFTLAGWFFVFARAWFDDGYRFGIGSAALIALLTLIYGWRHVYPELIVGVPQSGGAVDPWLHLGSRLVALACVGAVLFVAQTGRSGDLVEPRRRIRNIFVAVIGAHITVVAVAEIALLGEGPAPLATLLNIAAVDLELLAFIVVLLVAGEQVIPQPGAPDGTRVADEAASEDSHIADALGRFLENEHGYREAGLTIAGLAARLKVPEYRLRRVINQQLGYRNFPQFLNHYRIAEAQRWLADPDKAGLPILTIAMDLGYNSIGPFNRAFRAETDTNPAAWRAANSRKNSTDS